MHLLQAGVNITVIAIGLGHESPTTTYQYGKLMKERALKTLHAPKTTPARYRPKDQLLHFLEGL